MFASPLGSYSLEKGKRRSFLVVGVSNQFRSASIHSHWIRDRMRRHYPAARTTRIRQKVEQQKRDMPALKQPPPLQDLTMEVLVEFFFWFCQRGEDDPDKVSRDVASMKKEIASRWPHELASKFYNKLLKRLQRFDFSVEEDLTAICVKIITDETIIGLDCTSSILESLRPEDARRVRGISRLEVVSKLPHSLDNFHLEHLTVFKFHSCTDSILQLIVDNCPKLEHVDVNYSRAVTDVGLAALESCRQLQTLSISTCENVTASGLNRFLSVNESIRRLSAWPDYSDDAGFDFRQDPRWEDELSTRDSLESFTIGESFSNRHLLHVVTRFSNLRSIKIRENVTIDLSPIKALSKLSGICFFTGAGPTWIEFESLLEFFGPQIDKLTIWFENCSTMRRGVDSIFVLCENLESLEFFCRSESSQEKLVIPPFLKLKNLTCGCSLSRLAFGEMSKLEYLQVSGFQVDVSQVESIVVDQTRFPNLRVFRMEQFWDSRMDEWHRLRQIVETNNLDLDIYHSW